MKSGVVLNSKSTLASLIAASHAKAVGPQEYENETSLHLETGNQLKYEATPEGVHAIRVCSADDQEMGYWTADEIQEDPAFVLGAILGCATNAKLDPSIFNLDLQAISSLFVNSSHYYLVSDVDLGFVDELGAFKKGKCSLEELSAYEGPVLTAQLLGDRTVEFTLTAAEYCGLKWDSEKEAFSGLVIGLHNEKPVSLSFAREVAYVR